MGKDPPLTYVLLFSSCYSAPVIVTQQPQRPGRYGLCAAEMMLCAANKL